MAEKENFSNVSPNSTGVFKLGKQMTKRIKMLLAQYVLNYTCELSLSDEEKMKAWDEH